jgi:hypothetical protein
VSLAPGQRERQRGNEKTRELDIRGAACGRSQRPASLTAALLIRRYFAIVNERGDLYLTWGKSDEGKKMMDAEQRYDVKGITIQCVDGDADGDASNGIQQAFNLVLPKNRPVTAASKVRAAALYTPTAGRTLERCAIVDTSAVRPLCVAQRAGRQNGQEGRQG